MSDISKIDKNLKSAGKLNLKDVCFYNVKENSWCIYGLIFDEMFRRMPEDVAKKVNDGVLRLHTNTSGGRIRFKTDSEYIAISASMPDVTKFPHMPDTGISGFDMYDENGYVKTFVPPVELSGGYEDVYHFGSGTEREITINFPLYNNVKDLYIGLKKGSSFTEHTPYKNPRKIVYYGSSITQGGCVSRPGLSYPALVSLKTDCDFVNLGFSGSARGETVLAEYIASLEPDVFVMDYDHNAPDTEYLMDTHETFFKTFCKARQDTPVLFLSAPNIMLSGGDYFKRREIVYRTYINAKNAGNKNVYFIDGEKLWGEDFGCCTVDGIHPNDLGHYRMAQCVFMTIQKMENES